MWEEPEVSQTEGGDRDWDGAGAGQAGWRSCFHIWRVSVVKVESVLGF